MKVDCHNHTLFSPDGRQTAEELVRAAAERGVGILALTEHMDLGFPNDVRPPDEPIFDYRVTQAYFDEIERLRALYPSVEILAGIEAGFTVGDEQKTADALAAFPFEYVIHSVHICHGRDCYWKGYFDGMTKREAYGEYLDCVRASLDAPYDYDAVGHLGYIARPAPYADRPLVYDEFPERLDGILTEIVKRGKILEVNSSVGRSEQNGALTLPDLSVLARYRELGGERIVFGSDSHDPSRFLHRYDEVADAVRALGFREWTVKKRGETLTVRI